MLTLNNCNEFEINGTKYNLKIIGTTEKPWFKAVDVCKALGYVSTKEALARHVKNSEDNRSLNSLFDETKEKLPPGCRRNYEGQQRYISESGVYAIIFGSKLKNATQFRNWVFQEVLPSIRKEGEYILTKELEEAIMEKELAITAAEEAKKEKEEALLASKKLEEELEEAKNHALVLQGMLVSDTPLERNECVYISTSISYAQQNSFKIGGVESVDKLMGRMSSYNSNRVAGDEWFYTDVFMVTDYRDIERRLKTLLSRFRIRKEKEMYRLHYTNAKWIVELLCLNHDEEVNIVNKNLENFIFNLDYNKYKPIIPEPFETKTLVSVKNITSTGAVTKACMLSKSGDFEEKLTEYIKSIPSGQNTLSMSDIFANLNIRSGKRNLVSTVEDLLAQLRPDISLLRRKNYKIVDDLIKF